MRDNDERVDVEGGQEDCDEREKADEGRLSHQASDAKHDQRRRKAVERFEQAYYGSPLARKELGSRHDRCGIEVAGSVAPHRAARAHRDGVRFQRLEFEEKPQATIPDTDEDCPERSRSASAESVDGKTAQAGIVPDVCAERSQFYLRLRQSEPLLERLAVRAERIHCASTRDD